jgi:alkanesulfonate monooxygenase SsuD/methylene tetrahydromethanopterin reductase-like flavin-dependent oxidoreductase (luciferase family)
MPLHYESRHGWKRLLSIATGGEIGSMKFSLSLMNFDYFGDVNVIAQLAREAEDAGWDAVFISDHVNWKDMGFHVDPWIALGLIADRTERVLIGTAVTPIARRRPTKLAREILTLHQLSGGRFIFGAGSGIWASEYDDLGDASELKVRAEMLDEGLELLQKTWVGNDFSHHGKHYQAKGQTFCPGGAKIPIWVGASWPKRKPFLRAARFDGVMAMNNDFTKPLSVAHVVEIKQFIDQERDDDKPFDIAVGLNTTEDAASDVDRAQAYEAAGADWWQEGVFPYAKNIDLLRAIIRRGPPRRN